MHKGAFSCAEKLAKGEPTDQYVKFCMRLVDMLLSFGVQPLLVFDGRNLPSKQHVEEARRERRQSNLQKGKQLLRAGKTAEARECFSRAVSITPSMAHEVIKVARARGVDCLVAPYEADAQLAFLNKAGIAQAVITEDSDLLAFGCKKVILKMDKQGNGLEIDQCHLGRCRSLGDVFTEEKFRHMCILSGCDYLASLHGIGLGKACKLLKMANNPDILKVIKKMGQYLKMNISVPDEYIEGFVKANNTFLYQIVFDPIRRKVVPLNPYPDHVDPAALRYAGVNIGDQQGLQMALGNLDLNTLEKIDNFSPDAPPAQPSKAPPSRGWGDGRVLSARTVGSIWSRSYVPGTTEPQTPASPITPPPTWGKARMVAMQGLKLQVKRPREADVRRTLRRVNPTKAAGPDNIPGASRQLLLSLPKKSPALPLNDYRPVALTPIMMQCFERLVKDHIMSRLPATLDRLQFAYRPNRSTDDAISAALHRSLAHLENKNSYVRILFVDFSSAFNTVIPQHLVKKLSPLGIDTPLCNWLLDFLSDRPQTRDTIESVLTSSLPVWYGSCTASEQKSLQRVVRTAEKVIRTSLPSIQGLYLLRCLSRASKMVRDPTHPDHRLFSLLPSDCSMSEENVLDQYLSIPKRHCTQTPPCQAPPTTQADRTIPKEVRGVEGGRPRPRNRFATLLQWRNQSEESDGERGTRSRFFASEDPCLPVLGSKSSDSPSPDRNLSLESQAAHRRSEGPWPPVSPPSLPPSQSLGAFSCTGGSSSDGPVQSSVSSDCCCDPGLSALHQFLRKKEGLSWVGSPQRALPSPPLQGADDIDTPPGSPPSQDSAYFSQPTSGPSSLEDSPTSSPINPEVPEKEKDTWRDSECSATPNRPPVVREVRPLALRTKVSGLSRTRPAEWDGLRKVRPSGPARASGLRRNPSVPGKRSAMTNENSSGLQATISGLWKTFSFRKENPKLTPHKKAEPMSPVKDNLPAC
ncbi:hypothetical protein P4O66_001743 [Electrophorus voltai]|uniref:Exonuclease 1 n=1 Tax=Electrophorus voltai TaxID=2609070 RepID=A0AAD8Z4K7_9TELE|nr:hypothetical protein P4O66_001743 [Electrophorus voltai]